MQRYQNRTQAGKILAEALKAYAKQKTVLVLALPRGGVPVAYEVAQALQVPLDLLIVRKLGMPQHVELAMGAIAPQNIQFLNHEMIHAYHITKETLQTVIAKEREELKRREQVYREGRPFPAIEGKTIILIDDGIATGATMTAAIQALRTLKAEKIIVAVPVADQSIVEQFTRLADDFICPLQPMQLNAVGCWYEDFTQTEDEEVRRLLI